MKAKFKYFSAGLAAFGLVTLLVNVDATGCVNLWLFALVAWAVSVSIPE